MEQLIINELWKFADLLNMDLESKKINMKKKSIILLSIFIILLIGGGYLIKTIFFKKEQVIININKDIVNLNREISTTLNSPHKLNWSIEGSINDTIIINGGKVAPPFVKVNGTGDYYGPPNVIKFDYERYKASEVDLVVKYTFLGL